MLFNFANVLIFLLVAVGFVTVSLALGYFLRPKVPFPEKLATYECGELPTEPAWINFNIRFYILALLFIIFDVEIAFMFPVGAVFKQWVKDGAGLLALAEIGVFVGILLLGLIYAWIKGDLEWAKQLGPDEKDEKGEKTAGTGVVSRASKI